MEQQTIIKRYFFLYNGKKYEVRAQVPFRGKYLLTLVAWIGINARWENSIFLL